MGRGDFQKPGELFFQGSVVDVFLQVLVLVHQVFLDLMTHSFFKLSDAALLILDECHHAQVGNNHFQLYFIIFQGDKNHPYSQIMRDWYQQLKVTGTPTPKVLGLSACLVVKGTNEAKFRQNKKELEQVRGKEWKLYLTFLLR